MKKIISVFLLSIFLFNTVGYYVVFKVAQFEIKKEIKKEIKLGLKADDLKIIKFAHSEINTINWVEKGKEFIHLDQMFDIVKSTSDDSFITFYCINDKQEKKLFENLETQILKVIENNKNSKENSSKESLNTFIKTYFFEELSLVLFQNSSEYRFNQNNELYSSANILIPTPPPRG